jgi:signal transduction histidine kinase
MSGATTPDRSEPLGAVTVDGRGAVVDLDDRARAAIGPEADALLGRHLADLLDEPAIAVVSTVGHELRSPLTSIRGYSSLLRNRWDRIDDADKRMMLDQIGHDAERVTRLITELLDIGRLATGQLSLARAEVDVAEVARTVLASVGAGAPELDGEVVGETDARAVADADKVEQVLTNLVENAVKYGDPSGLRIEIAVVGAGEGGGEAKAAEVAEVAVTVLDRGPGVAPEDRDRIFDRGYQRERDRPTGTGLGLWISRGLVEAHGGRLTVTSGPEGGAAFTFTLPAAGG